MRVDAERLRTKRIGAGYSSVTSVTTPAGGGAGANPTMPRSTAYRDDLPELYRDRLWCRGLESDPSLIDELKKSAGYVEPEGSGRWGTPARLAIARTMAEARGVPVPLSVGRECGNCAFYASEVRDFESRTPGACGKLKVVVFGNAGCVLARPFGAPPTAAAGAPRPPQAHGPGEPVEAAEPMASDGAGQLFQPNDIIDEEREKAHLRFTGSVSPEGRPAAFREKPPLPPAV